MIRGLQPLREVQADGAAPGGSAWMSASAGTGKTQVLTARVLRLLLGGAAPERILALTFTKAGAAEMQGRVFDRLAAWVGAGDNELKSDLAAIRADTGPDTCARARQLFARTLDARGGLNVQTIHGFAQSLLASFPVEAGIAPGFAALDDRSALALRSRVLAEAIEAAQAEGDTGFADDVGAISVASGEARLATIAATLIGAYDAIAQLGASVGFDPKLRRAFGLPTGGTAAEVMAEAVGAIDEAGLRRLAVAHLRSGVAKGATFADHILGWLGCSPVARVAHFDDLCRAFHTTTGEPLKQLIFGGKKADPADLALATALCEAVSAVAATRRLLDAASNAARHLRVGARLGSAYAAHKHRAGVIDYDDMIARAAKLLTADGAGAWVRYKLDQRIDHLLVDEAQDTNEAQWDIVEALTDEFFDGQGARDVDRTLFVVGDFKQAIFSFQGSDPKIFEGRQGHFRAKAEDAGLRWRDLPLSESFRSTPAVLEAVDAVVDHLGHTAFGTRDPIPVHIPARSDAVGSVTLWPPLVPAADEEASDDDAPWLPAAQVLMAQRLAKQIAAWLDPGTALVLVARQRRVRPEDILVLVRSRGAFVGALVAALHDLRVPVAGVDRLRLTAPLAVQDLLALIRFALQPGDDLTCAALLTSPFVGLGDDALFALAHDRGRASLWSRVQAAGGAAHDFLGSVLALADYSAPYEFLETILSGPLQGRRRLLARLGEEARDPIAALLGQALAFETANAPSLQGFLAWIEADDIDLKRDPEAAIDAVRIMTVHGAKGLQAPVVVLADATRAPTGDRDGHVMLTLDGVPGVPVFHGGKAGKVGLIAEQLEADAADASAEHWRLLYVALTRAEDLLFIGGALAKPRGEAAAKLPEASWYAAVEAAMVAAWDPVPEPDPVWGEIRVHRAGTVAIPEVRPPATARGGALETWALTPAPPEARPPRPLSPSALADDDIAVPPPTPAMQRAARRGQLLHTLFERLPPVAADRRAAVAHDWLARTAPDLADDHAGIAATALGIIEAPEFAALFGPDALAEAPIAATVGETVIAGTVDRLLVEPGRVRLIDFKTGARIPASAAAVAPYHLRQMAAYLAALARIFPGRRIDAALLYTHDATLIELPPALLARYAPGT